jgi:hypothetical protein
MATPAADERAIAASIDGVLRSVVPKAVGTLLSRASVERT